MSVIAPRPVLYVCPHGLVAARRGRDGWQVCARFAATGAAEFAAWLRRHPDARFDLLVDVQDEEQHLERLPRVRARDLRLLVKRRIEQRYREAEFSLVTPLAPVRGRWSLPARPQPSPDGTQPMLLSAIRGGDALAPWLPMLRGAERAIVSMVSPALLGALAAQRIARGADGLLVSLAPGGLRQTLVIGGRLRFSRLAASIDGSDPQAVQAELARTLQYLQMSQALPNGALAAGGFAVWLLPHGFAEVPRLVSGVEVDGGRRAPVTVHPLARFGVRALAGEGAADTGALALWLDPSLRRPLGAGYAHAGLRRFETLAGWRRALWAAGGVAATGAAVALVGAELVAAGSTDDPRRLVPSASVAAEIERLQREIAAHPLTGAEIEATVLGAEALARRTVDAPALLRAIGEAMPADDALRLTRISWSRVPAGGAGGEDLAGGQVATPAAGVGIAVPAAVPVPTAVAGTTPAAGAEAAAPGAAMRPAAVAAFLTPVEVQIRGTVDAGRPKTQANALVERLAAALALGCGCEASVQRWPYERGPEAGWGATLGATGAAAAVEFAIAMVRPEPAAPLGAATERIDVAGR
jgi:hypothetical protein